MVPERNGSRQRASSPLCLPTNHDGNDIDPTMEDPIPATTAPAMDTPAIILPPPEIRSIVDKTASFVAKSPKPEAFEDKMRARQATDSRFAFMNKEDAYHA